MSTPPIHAPVLGLFQGCLVVQALRMAVEYDIPDILAADTLDHDELAARTGTSAQPMLQAMRFLAGLGYFRATPDGRFELTPLGETLRNGHPSQVRNLVLTIGGSTVWGALEQFGMAVRTGRSGVELAHGSPLFELLRKDPAAAEHFNGMMQAVNGPEPAAVAAAYDFSGVGRLVDVGGGLGVFLHAVLDAFPTVRGTLFELPPVLAEAGLPGTGGRFDAVGGSFFDGVPTGADMYLLSHILHNWPDEDARTILGHCRDGLAENGRVLIVETVLPGGDGPHLARMLDVTMLTLVGGRERTAEEYRELLAVAGLEMTRIVPTRSAADIIEAVRR